MTFSVFQLHAADSFEHAASIRVKNHKKHSTKAIQARVTSFVCTSREEGRCTPRDPKLEGTGWWVLHSVCCNNCVSKNRLRPQMCLSLGFWKCFFLLLLLASMCYWAWKNDGLMKSIKSEESLQLVCRHLNSSWLWDSYLFIYLVYGVACVCDVRCWF